MTALRDLVTKNLETARRGLAGRESDERVSKAFSAGKPALGGPAEYADSTPSLGIPPRPSHGPSGTPGSWRLQAPAVPVAAGYNLPGTWVLATNPGPGTSPDGQPVKSTWQYHQAQDVTFPAEKTPVGVGDNTEDYNDSSAGLFVGQPRVGDLVHFNGAGDSTYQAKLVQVTTGYVIGEFEGQTIVFPTDAITPHNVGGSDHAPDGAVSGITKSKCVMCKGRGKIMDGNRKCPNCQGEGVVEKDQASAPYEPHTPEDLDPNGDPSPTNPDDGAPLTPYDDMDFDPDGTALDTGPGNNVQSGGLTPTEYSLIDRVVNHGGPMPIETAALKALRVGDAEDHHLDTLKKALKRHSFAVPAAAGAARSVSDKL